MPNLKGHPLVDEWPVVLFRPGRFERVEVAAVFPARLSIGAGALPNVGDADTEDLVPLIEEAVHEAQNYVHEARKRFQEAMDSELLGLAEKRDVLLAKHRRLIQDLFESAEDRTRARNKRDRESERVEDEFKWWWD